MRGGIDAAGQAVQHARHLPGARPRAHHALLGAAQLRRRDHLHGLGDLLRRFHGADAPPDIDQRRHLVRSNLLAWILRVEAFIEDRCGWNGLHAAFLAANCCLNSFSAALISAFSASSICFFSASVLSVPEWRTSKTRYSSVSYAPTSLVGT